MKTGIAAIVLCVLLAGCETFSGPRLAEAQGWQPVTRRDCMFNNCTVNVRVVDGKVEVDAQELKMYIGSRDLILRWALVTPGYEFRADEEFLAPIIFKGENAADAPNQFSQRRIGARGQTVMIVNQNRNSKKYTYKVRVYKPAPSTEYIETDPVIFNDF